MIELLSRVAYLKLSPFKLIALAICFVSAACVQTTPLPQVVRNGESVIIGLGGITRNFSGNYSPDGASIDVYLHDSEGSVFELGVPYLFKAYPDYASMFNAQQINGLGSTDELGLSVFDGGVFIRVDLSDSSGPTTAAPGDAYIEIVDHSGDLTNTGLSMYGINEGNHAHIPIIIRAGEPVPFTWEYNSQFLGYLDQTHMTVSANLSGAPDVDYVAGAQLTIFQTNVSAHSPLYVVPVAHNPYVHLLYNVVDHGDDTATISVYLTAMDGYRDAGSRTHRSALLSDMAIKIVNMASNKKFDFALDYTESFYVDDSGNRINEIIPVLQ